MLRYYTSTNSSTTLLLTRQSQRYELDQHTPMCGIAGAHLVYVYRFACFSWRKEQLSPLARAISTEKCSCSHVLNFTNLQRNVGVPKVDNTNAFPYYEH